MIIPEHPIIAAVVHCDFAQCRLGLAEKLPSALVIGLTADGKQLGMPVQEHEDNVTLGPPYRLFCDKLPPKAEILVDLATVVPTCDVMSPEMWLADRHDPRFVDMHCTYQAYGQPQSDRSRLSFDKGESL